MRCLRLRSVRIEVYVAISVQDYLIDQGAIDWPEVLSAWRWLLPSELTLWFANRFADLFLLLPDGTVHMLDVGAGSLAKLADSRDDFSSKIEENANNWLMIPLVDQLVAAGKRLQPGQCYGLIMPPVIGGDYTIENCAVYPIGDYLGAYGSIQEQISDLPDGTQVVIKVRKEKTDEKS
jgi:hypothetical protein